MSEIETLKLQKIENLLMAALALIQQKSNTKSQLSILTQKELLEQLNIAPNTLKTWERNGLKRLEPPIENCRTVYYKISDVIDFLTN
ncbi:hypothetical protein [Lactococcus petauri]|uniref:hypothetical protein n=1 Tax=Lactococcus petauri TaxID=1940789 RepID=UPI0022E23B64|nr:hypothetical protein [Lactococcus petauri]